LREGSSLSPLHRRGKGKKVSEGKIISAISEGGKGEGEESYQELNAMRVSL